SCLSFRHRHNVQAGHRRRHQSAVSLDDQIRRHHDTDSTSRLQLNLVCSVVDREHIAEPLTAVTKHHPSFHETETRRYLAISCAAWRGPTLAILAIIFPTIVRVSNSAQLLRRWRWRRSNIQRHPRPAITEVIGI